MPNKKLLDNRGLLSTPIDPVDIDRIIWEHKHTATNKPFLRTFDHGTGPIDLRHLGQPTEYRPTELHLKANGDINEHPSFALVLEHPEKPPIFAQLSLNTLVVALRDVGYKLIKP